MIIEFHGAVLVPRNHVVVISIACQYRYPVQLYTPYPSAPLNSRLAKKRSGPAQGNLDEGLHKRERLSTEVHELHVGVDDSARVGHQVVHAASAGSTHLRVVLSGAQKSSLEKTVDWSGKLVASAGRGTADSTAVLARSRNHPGLVFAVSSAGGGCSFHDWYRVICWEEGQLAV